MISLDSNLLIYAYDADCPFHEDANLFLQSIRERTDIVLSEFTLVEFYRLLRNPAVLGRPLSAEDAVELIMSYREHPRWRITGFPAESKELHDWLWRTAGAHGFAFRRIFDARLALAPRAHGVTEFATAKVKDFEGFGFKRVWNPLANV